MSSTQLEDQYEQQSDKHIAHLLGISVEEYHELEHDGIQDDGSEDGFVNRQYIRFEDTSPKHILQKIKGLDPSNTFYFDLGSFKD